MSEQKEERKLKGFKLPIELVEKFEAACEERDIQEQDGAEEALRQWTDGRYASDQKEKGMVSLLNWDPNAVCLICSKKIPLALKILFKQGVGAVCPTCALETTIEEKSDPVTLKNAIILERQKRQIHKAKKILQDLFREIDRTAEALKVGAACPYCPELKQLHQEAYELEINVYKKFDELIKDRGLIPNKEAIHIFLLEAEKIVTLRGDLGKRIRETELNPLSLAKIKESIQTIEHQYYVSEEVQSPREIADRRSDEEKAAFESKSEEGST